MEYNMNNIKTSYSVRRTRHMYRKFSATIAIIFIIGMLIPPLFSSYGGTEDSPAVVYPFSLSRQKSSSTRGASEEYFHDDLSNETGISFKENLSVTNGQAQLKDNRPEPGEDTVGLWHFDNETWNTAYDSSGHGNNGTIYGGNIADGLFGGSLELDGVNDYVGVPYNNKFNFGTASFSITGWFKSPGPYLGGSISVRVNESSDDAEEWSKKPEGGMDLTSNDLQLVENGDKGDQNVGMRFQNVEIPLGATIKNAYIEFESANTDTDTTDLLFYCEDTDDATSFTTNDFDISSRPKTTKYIPWNNVPPWNLDGKNQTVNLSPIIQEVVDRDGWAFGNSLAVIIIGNGVRTAKSFDGDSSAAPILVVDFVLEQYIVSHYDSDQGFKVWLTADGNLSFGIDDDATWGPDHAIRSSNSYQDNAWHNFAAVKDSRDAMYLYVDGELVGSDLALTTGTLSSDSAVLNIGCDGPTKSDYFRGNIDELCITNTTITQGEAANNVRLYRPEGRLRSIEIAPPESFVWDSVSFKGGVPNGTSLNITVYDASTGQELMRYLGNLSAGSFDISSLNPLTHPSLYLEARLQGSINKTPALLEWSVYIQNPDSPILLNDIRTIYILEDKLDEHILDLSEYFEDSYSSFSGPVYALHNNSGHANINLSVSGSNLSVDYLTDNWTGNASVIVSCTNVFGISTLSSAFDVVVVNVNDPPSCRHISPLDGVILEYTNVTLSWDAFDVDNDPEDISYDLFFSEGENPSLHVSGLKATNHSIAELDGGTTYYWYVVAKDTISSSVSRDGIWSFAIRDQDVPILRTKLLSPKNTAEIDTNSINLKWETTNTREDPVSYRILLNTTIDNLTVIAVTNEENYLITNLDMASIYYWSVIPVAGLYEGECVSGIWSFFVNNSFKPLIEFDVTAEISSLDIERNVNSTFNITVWNTGNVPITLFFELEGSLADYTYVQPSVVARLGVATNVVVTVNLTGTAVEGINSRSDYQLIIKITCENITKELVLPVTVKGEDPATDDDSGTENESGILGSVCGSIYIWIIIILVALLIVQAFYLFRKRREPEKLEPLEFESLEPEPLKPEPAPELEIEEPHRYGSVPEGYVPLFINPRYRPVNLRQKNMDEDYEK